VKVEIHEETIKVGENDYTMALSSPFVGNLGHDFRQGDGIEPVIAWGATKMLLAATQPCQCVLKP
jgi:hypothetical protein